MEKVKKMFYKLAKDFLFSFAVVYSIILVCCLIAFAIDPVWK